MARLRNDKSQKAAPAKSVVKTSKKSRSAVLKEQIAAFGGSSEDYELVKDADETMASGSADVDVGCLSNIFLRFYVNQLKASTLERSFQIPQGLEIQCTWTSTDREA